MHKLLKIRQTKNKISQLNCLVILNKLRILPGRLSTAKPKCFSEPARQFLTNVEHFQNVSTSLSFELVRIFRDCRVFSPETSVPGCRVSRHRLLLLLLLLLFCNFHPLRFFRLYILFSLSNFARFFYPSKDLSVSKDFYVIKLI